MTPTARPRFAALTTLALLSVITTAVRAQSSGLGNAASGPSRSGFSDVEHTTENIITQPNRDAGLMSVDIPAPLMRASAAPYALPNEPSCEEIETELGELNALLGPESVTPPDSMSMRVAKVAEAGGRAAVNSIVPFRTFVREVSGAALAQRPSVCLITYWSQAQSSATA